MAGEHACPPIQLSNSRYCGQHGAVNSPKRIASLISKGGFRFLLRNRHITRNPKVAFRSGLVTTWPVAVEKLHPNQVVLALPGLFVLGPSFLTWLLDRSSRRLRLKGKEPHQAFEVLYRRCQIELLAYEPHSA
jgi:hypothetical protein